MKKLTSLMMAAALAVSITACGATANANATASSATDKSTATGEAGNETVTITYPEYMIPGVMSDGTPKKDHTWDDGVVTTKPTAEKEGVKTYTCKVCNETKTETIPRLNSSGK